MFYVSFISVCVIKFIFRCVVNLKENYTNTGSFQKRTFAPNSCKDYKLYVHVT